MNGGGIFYMLINCNLGYNQIIENDTAHQVFNSPEFPGSLLRLISSIIQVKG